MSNGVNKSIIIGFLGSDPELRHTAAGASVCNLRVATNERWTDKAGQKQEHTEWHRVTVWGARAQAAAKYLEKGRQVYVEGRLRTRQWEDKDGVTRYTTEIVATDIQFLGSASKSKPAGKGSDAPQPADADDFEAEFDFA